MKKLAALFVLLPFSTLFAEGPYPVDPASVRKEGVPTGKLTQAKFSGSKIFPGTERDYWVYVPSQYDGSKPACLMVFQDGGGYIGEKGSFKVPIVFDNLIATGEMPVTIGVFISPGVVPATRPDAQPRFNRSYEYDGFSADYSKFLLDEILPVALKDLNVSTDPNDRGICGSSSGAIAAFNVAWFRPDSFRRVYSTIGTYVGLRGGDEIVTLLRKTEPKPLRIFLQDGSNDNNIYCGDWWMANQAMERALTFSGYEVNHVWGEGKHSGKHGGAIFPEAMRWLWQEHPKPVTTHFDVCKGRTRDVLIEGKNWELVSEGHGFTEGPVASADGTVYFSDIPNSKIHVVSPDGKISLFLGDTQKTNGLAFGPDGRLYGCRTGSGEIVSWDVKSREEKIHATGIKANDLVVMNDGVIYATEPATKSVWIIRPGQEKVLGSDQFSGVNGIEAVPDQGRFDVTDPGNRFVWSIMRQPDGSLANLQPYHHLHLPPGDLDNRSRADGTAMTENGWLLVATSMGVQVCEQPGRVNLIIPLPIGARFPSNLCFAGPDRKTLYATAGDKVFKRETKLTGINAWDAPAAAPKPGL